MTARRRVELLNRLARLREVEKRMAAAEAAEAADAYFKLKALQERSAEIAASYRGRDDWLDGGALARQFAFLDGIAQIRRDTEEQCRKAAEQSAEAQTKVGIAERRREVTHDRLASERRSVDRRAQTRAATESPNLARKLNSL